MSYNYTSLTNGFQCNVTTINSILLNPIKGNGQRVEERKPFRPKNTIYYKKKPASFYLWSKTCRMRHKPLRLDRFPQNESKKIRCGIYIGHLDERCAYCPFHGIKHGFTLQPTLNCICRFKSLTPSPLKQDITKHMVVNKHTTITKTNISWNTGNKQISKQIDRIINHMCMNSLNKRR